MLKPELCARGVRRRGAGPFARVRLSHLPRPEKPRRLAGGRGSEAAPGCLGRHLVLMVKAPVLGGVKTRLARGVGYARATSFYRSVTNSVLSRVASARRWHTYLAVSPDGALLSRAWPYRTGGGEVMRFAQGRGDLGRRMQRVMDGMPLGPVVIVGSDIPTISSHHIASAFSALGRSDAVFGPSPDGGYWLVGLARRPRVIQAFSGVRWSSSQTLDDTLRNFGGRKVERLEVLADVDEASDLARLGLSATRRVVPA